MGKNKKLFERFLAEEKKIAECLDFVCRTDKDFGRLLELCNNFPGWRIIYILSDKINAYLEKRLPQINSFEGLEKLKRFYYSFSRINNPGLFLIERREAELALSDNLDKALALMEKERDKGSELIDSKANILDGVIAQKFEDKIMDISDPDVFMGYWRQYGYGISYPCIHAQLSKCFLKMIVGMDENDSRWPRLMKYFESYHVNDEELKIIALRKIKEFV